LSRAISEKLFHLDTFVFLTTTANQKFWNPAEKTLFLGEWCKLHRDREIWSQMEYEVLPFNWEERQQVIQSSGYINKLYSKYLKVLSKRFNELHQVDYDLRYWRIIIGPWLFYFLTGLYDRYLSIRSAIGLGTVTNTWLPENPSFPHIPKDYDAFVNWNSNDDYNLYLYSWIIRELDGIPYETKNETLHLPQVKYVPIPKGVKFFLKSSLYPLLQKIPERYKRIVLVSSYFQFWDLFRLQLSLRQIPILFSPPEVPTVAPDLTTRSQLKLIGGKNEFETLAEKLIALQLPTAYVESYKSTHQTALEYFPKKPKVILTSNSLFAEEGFKFWAAHHVSLGAKLAGVQHGGGYGTRKVDSVTYNEIRACDRYYTWGWKLNGSPKTRPLPAGKLIGLKKIKTESKGNLLVIGISNPRYAFQWNGGDTVGPHMGNYFNEQIRFFQNLESGIQTQFVFRLYPHDYDWDVTSRLLEIEPRFKTYTGKQSMMSQLKQSRLCVSTNNSTTFLETLTINHPTVVFWNFEHCPLRKNVQPYFDELRKTGILHDTPESAASMINKVFNNPAEWWNGPAVQKTIKTFCERFALSRPHPLRDWKKELLALSKEK